ncbi:MAG: hypothetical protein ACKOA8_14515 [Deltaproteobacteria bacterium]
MKGGLLHIPGETELAHAYEQLQFNAVIPSLDELIRYAQWTRFDPRLAEIWIQFLVRHFEQINPLKLRRKALKSIWPSTLGVLCEFSKNAIQRVRPKEFGLFVKWAELVTFQIPKAKNELYFIGLRNPKSDELAKDAQYSTSEYEQWGYFSRENLLPKTQNSKMNKTKRLFLLQELGLRNSILRTSEYWDALGRSISMRQAERDIRESGFFRAFGKTSSRRWIAKVPTS